MSCSQCEGERACSFELSFDHLSLSFYLSSSAQAVGGGFALFSGGGEAGQRETGGHDHSGVHECCDQVLPGGGAAGSRETG